MSRYVLKFQKQGYMKYISHLDLLRLFKRSFKRIDVKLQHSQGFNPHPKMSFVQPLSLGYTSTAEYLEFETIQEEQPDLIVQKLKIAMPEGIGIVACRMLLPSKKTLAAMVGYARYDLQLHTDSICNWEDKIKDFLEQEKILILKKQKKTKNYIEQDIKNMIYEFSVKEINIDDKYIMFTSLIAAGSISNLNPESMLKCFLDFIPLPFEKESISIERKEIYCTNQQDAKPILIFEM